MHLLKDFAIVSITSYAYPNAGNAPRTTNLPALLSCARNPFRPTFCIQERSNNAGQLRRHQIWSFHRSCGFLVDDTGGNPAASLSRS